jgi:outer membrane protein assembly factor BamB
MRFRISLALAAVAAAPCLAQPAWPQWRGPNRDGVARDFQAPAAWPRSLARKWRVSIAPSYSSPVADASRVYLHTREEDLEVAVAHDRATGRILWRKSYSAPFKKNSYALKMGRGPFSTPVLDGGRVYTFGSTAILSCWNAADGALVWRKEYSGEMDTGRLFTGTAMSPIIAGGLLIVHTGDDRRGAVRALDPATGDERWNWVGDGPGYASPVAATFGGVAQVTTLTDRRAIGLALDSGELLWSVPFKDEWNENIVTPVVHGRRLILSGVRTGTFALEIARGAGGWSAKKLWHNDEVAMYMSSPVAAGEALYGLSSKRKGQFVCLDAASGKLRWATTGRETENAALISAGAHLLILTVEGDLIVASASPTQWQEAVRYKVADAASWSHPAALGREIVVKDDAALTMWTVGGN